MVIIDESGDADCRVQAIDWLERNFGGRTRSGDGKMLYIQSRLHEADVPGHVLSDGSCDWPHLVLPP